MASIIVGWPHNRDNWSIIKTRDEPDLPEHIRESAYWARFDGNPKQSAYFVDIPGMDDKQAVEFINQQWHHVFWNYKNNTYITKREHVLLDKAREQYRLGW
jgi:hypothetical protein